MPLTHEDFGMIYQAIDSHVKKSTQFFIQSPVTRRDVDRKLIWVEELGPQSIPLIGFTGTAKVYDEGANGEVRLKRVKVEPDVPQVGEQVLIALHLGQRGLPKALGVIQSTMLDEED